MHRIGIATQAVRTRAHRYGRQPGRRGPYKVIPYSAVIYDNDGSTWTYVETAARTFMRERITVRVIRGGTAVVPGTRGRGHGGDGGGARAARHRVQHQR